jgi:hypothetical protein
MSLSTISFKDIYKIPNIVYQPNLQLMDQVFYLPYVYLT